MNHIKYRIGVLTIVVLLAAYIVLSGSDSAAFEDKPSRRDEQHKDAVRAKSVRIDKELATLKDHPWAGEYFYGDGLGVNRCLCLSPKEGAVFTWHGCMGLYDQNYGTVTVTGDRIRIAWQLATDDKPEFPNEFLSVRWGTRRYLIPVSEVLTFCNDITNEERKWEPRNEIHGFHYLRRGDQQTPVTGRPVLPKEFEKYWTIKSISGAIKKLGDVTRGTEYVFDNKKHTHFTQSLTLDIGAAHAVLPQMRFELIGQDSFGFVTVTQVNDNEAEAIVQYELIEGNAPKTLAVGMKVKTRQ